jgi:hypothetical protein
MKYDKAATCQEEDVGCVDCFLWKFENGTHTKPTTSSTATSTASSRTRTVTCKTPGWWGCRDETTTMISTTSFSSSSTTSTSTCQTVSFPSHASTLHPLTCKARMVWLQGYDHCNYNYIYHVGGNDNNANMY